MIPIRFNLAQCSSIFSYVNQICQYINIDKIDNQFYRLNSFIIFVDAYDEARTKSNVC